MHRSISATAVLLVLSHSLVAAAIPVGGSSSSQCNVSLTLEDNQVCEVPYLDTVTLRCPESSNSTGWFRLQDLSVPVCGEAVCTLTRVTQWSTGSYVCRVMEGGAKEMRDHVVNLVVLAPPALLGVVICTTPERCRSPQPVVFWRDRQLRISVSYKGTGNFSVSWSKLRDDGTSAPFTCSAYLQPNHCKIDVLLNQQVITLFNNPFQREDMGTYIANVTNEFGYNTSTTSIAIRCNPVFPTKPSHVGPQHVSLVQGSVKNITCSAEMDSSTNLITCYDSPYNTSHCSTCLAYTTGTCSSIETKPHWTINSAISYPTEPCKPQREVRIAISGVETEDAGTISCYWLAAAVPGRVLYARRVVIVD